MATRNTDDKHADLINQMFATFQGTTKELADYLGIWPQNVTRMKRLAAGKNKAERAKASIPPVAWLKVAALLKIRPAEIAPYAYDEKWTVKAFKQAKPPKAGAPVKAADLVPAEKPARAKEPVKRTRKPAAQPAEQAAG
jgi:hypothetical protein